LAVERSNYRLLRFMGSFMTLFNAFLIAVILVGWVYAAFSGQGLQPFEITWAIPVFGLAFAEICRAVAGIADDKSRGE